MQFVQAIMAIAYGQYTLKLPLAKAAGKKPEGPFISQDLAASHTSFGEQGDILKKWAKAYFGKNAEGEKIEGPEWEAAFKVYTKVMESKKCTEAEFPVVNKIAGTILSCEKEMNPDFDQKVDGANWDAQIEHLETMCQLVEEAEKAEAEAAAKAAEAAKAEKKAPTPTAPIIPSIAGPNVEVALANTNTGTALAALQSIKPNSQAALRTMATLMNQMADMVEAASIAEEAIANTENPA